MKHLAFFFAGALLAAAGCGTTGSPAGGGEDSSWNRKPAPDFKLKDLDGREVSLASFRGKPVLLNFWGVDCPNCKREVPSLVRLHERYRDSGLVILGVNVWDEKPAKIKEFAAERGIRYPLLVEGSKVANRYGIEVIPTNFFIDPEGKVTSMEVGFDGEEKLEQRLKQLLSAKSD